MNAGPSPAAPELVVLLNDDGTPCGTAPKSEVHTDHTPLHLAFSCWVLDDAGRTLLTRRAAGKRTWPLVWTNTFCGHPGPGEPVADAVRRRARQELGCDIERPAEILPDFRYRAVMSDGTVENEICPVYTTRLRTEPRPNPDEIDALSWIPLADLPALVAEDPERYSPWMRDQLALLSRRTTPGSASPCWWVSARAPRGIMEVTPTAPPA